MTHPIVDYLAVMNLESGEDREVGLTELVAAEVRYLDPHAPHEVNGRGELAEILAPLRARLPDVLIESVGAVQSHHGAFLQRWRMMRGAVEFSSGHFSGLTAEDGRLQLVLGFVDPPPGLMHDTGAHPGP
jgi:hypothetical protein